MTNVYKNFTWHDKMKINESIFDEDAQYITVTIYVNRSCCHDRIYET